MERLMVRAAGVEPAISTFQVWRDDHLPYALPKQSAVSGCSVVRVVGSDVPWRPYTLLRHDRQAALARGSKNRIR